MIDFEYIEGPYGIPIYLQHLPVGSVSIRWIVFAGSADDHSVGAEGIYHWFEHVPSRGTKKFPGGYLDTESRLVQHGGTANAETWHTHTAYYAHVPRNVWADKFEILTDMIAAPLLREEDIRAEREIIREEIGDYLSSAWGASEYYLPSLVWPGHSFGHAELGSQESLDSMTPDQLKAAHERGYSRSRVVLFLAGDLTVDEVIEVVEQHGQSIPDRPLSVRRRPAEYGRLPDWPSGQEKRKTLGLGSGVVYLLFPIPPLQQVEDRFLCWIMVDHLCTAGSLGAPLQRMVREMGQLAYTVDSTSFLSPDGGYWGLVAEAGLHKLDQICDAFWRLLEWDELRSEDRFAYVRDNIAGEIAMRDPAPDEYTEVAAAQLLEHGAVWSDKEYQSLLTDISHETVIDHLDTLTPDLSYKIIFD